LEGVKPGKMNLELENGYKLSFSLPDTVKSYAIKAEPITPSRLAAGGDYVYINEVESGKTLLGLVFFITPVPLPCGSIVVKPERTIALDRYVDVHTPIIIDNIQGSVDYYYPQGNPGVNPFEAVMAEATYPIQSWVEGDTRMCVMDVRIHTEKGPKAMPIFQEVLNSMHLSGPGIQ
jgi:hypothetical protein